MLFSAEPRQASSSIDFGLVLAPYDYGKNASYPSSEVPLNKGTPLKLIPTIFEVSPVSLPGPKSTFAYCCFKFPSEIHELEQKVKSADV